MGGGHSISIETPSDYWCTIEWYLYLYFILLYILVYLFHYSKKFDVLLDLCLHQRALITLFLHCKMSGSLHIWVTLLSHEMFCIKMFVYVINTEGFNKIIKTFFLFILFNKKHLVKYDLSHKAPSPAKENRLHETQEAKPKHTMYISRRRKRTEGEGDKGKHGRDREMRTRPRLLEDISLYLSCLHSF